MGQAVIVTGGAGFIGSHLVDAVVTDGRRAVLLDELSTGRADCAAAEADLETVDITDASELHRIVRIARPVAIFHLAAQSSVTASVSDPQRDYAVNVQGTLNVIETAKRHRVPVVFSSTGGALYGNDAPMLTNEEFIPAPLAPYGASKWAGEVYVLTWARADNVPHAICRLGNVYGPRQSPHGEAASSPSSAIIYGGASRSLSTASVSLRATTCMSTTSFARCSLRRGNLASSISPPASRRHVGPVSVETAPWRGKRASPRRRVYVSLRERSAHARSDRAYSSRSATGSARYAHSPSSRRGRLLSSSWATGGSRA